MTSYSVVGKEVPRIDGGPKALGEAKYAADLFLPGMLYGKILRSRHPHARLLSVRTEKARRLPGVRVVVTAQDVPAVRYGTFIQDQTLFATDKVRYLGDEVAAVAAIDLDTAEEALSLIEVDYEELPAVFDPMEAILPEAPLLHEEAPTYSARFQVKGQRGNIACQTTYGYGDLEVGFREADEVFEHTFRTHQNHQTYLEPHGALAAPDGQGGVTVWVTTQGVFYSQATVAHCLGLPLSKVRVIGTTVGGGFGGKKPRIEHYTALLALKSRRPVRMEFTRDEEFIAGLPRHPTVIEIRSGVKRDGRLTAREAKLYYDTGAYADHGPAIAAGGAFQARGPYRIPHVRAESFTIYTNKTISGAFRGYGNPQANFAVESHMDIISRELDIDPLDLRLMNAMGHGDRLVNGQRLPEVWFRDTLEAAARRAGWREDFRRGRPGRRRGRGLACGSHVSGGLSSSALVKVMEDGSIQVVTGVIEIGAGEVTVAAQVAAEELRVGVGDIRVISADTDGTPHEHPTAASRITYNMGNAVRLAAEDARRQLLSRAAQMLEARAEDLEMRGKRVFLPGAPEKGLTYGEIVKAGHTKGGGPILGRGVFYAQGPPVDPSCQDGTPRPGMASMTFCTHVAEVEVEEETGEVKVLRLICVHDVGQVINPRGIQGQIEGGVAQGVGYALIEEVVYAGGVVTNPSLIDYKVPNILDVPPIEYEFIEKAEASGPFGAKGVSEAVLVPTAAAIANAVYDAVGARIFSLPLTPEKVLSALRSTSRRK